jgi:hypothetical protein
MLFGSSEDTGAGDRLDLQLGMVSFEASCSFRKTSNSDLSLTRAPEK